MSIETSPNDVSSPEKPVVIGETSSLEFMGEADGISYAVETDSQSVVRASFEYKDIIAKIKSSLEQFGYDPSKAFDTTILNWLEHHCITLPVDIVRINSTVADWEGWDQPRAPWFDKFEAFQKEYDQVAQLMAPGMPLGQRPEIEMLLDGQLIWSGFSAPN